MIKIYSREELIPIIEELKKQGKKIGFTSGNYDLLHSGHAKFMVMAKKMCDFLIVGVNTDKSVKLYKDINRPFIPEQFRAELIASLKPVDYVFLFDERRNAVNIEVLKPDFYIKGGDYDAKTMTSTPIVEKYGGKAVVLPIFDDISTTKVIQKITTVYGTQEKNEQSAESIPEKPKEKSKAVFIDRDGVINKEVEYLHEPEKFELFPGVLEGMKKMQEKGYKLIVVTTQAGIGLGYFSKEDFYKVNRKMLREVSSAGIVLDKIYFCPHGKRDNCECRKPKIGLLLRAKDDLNIDFEKSYFIGDKTQDIQAGKNAACKTIGVDTGHGCKDKEFDVVPDYQAKDLLDAVNFID